MQAERVVELDGADVEELEENRIQEVALNDTIKRFMQAQLAVGAELRRKSRDFWKKMYLKYDLDKSKDYIVETDQKTGKSYIHVEGATEESNNDSTRVGRA